MKTTIQTTIRKSFLVLLTAVALASCTKDDDINPDNGPSGDLLLVEEKVNGQTVHSFEYDKDNRMTIRRIHDAANGSVTQTQFSYNNKGLMISASHSGAAHYTEEYTYDSEDKVISGIWKFGDGLTFTIQYSYSGNTVSEIAVLEEVMSTTTYTFNNSGKNITGIVSIGGGLTGISTQEYGDYDDKHYRFTAYPWSWKLRSSNNAGSFKLTDYSGITLDQIWEYTYNDAGYPVKAEVYNRGSDEVVETREYSYVPAK